MSVWCVVLFKPGGHVQSICLRLRCSLPQGQAKSKWSILPLACLNGETTGLFKFVCLEWERQYDDWVFLLFICCICDTQFSPEILGRLLYTFWQPPLGADKVVWSHNMMVWYFLSDNHRVRPHTFLLFSFGFRDDMWVTRKSLWSHSMLCCLQSVVEISLQSHRYIFLTFRSRCSAFK
jgi:hypothetical protein